MGETRRQPTVGGREFRLTYWSYPRWLFTFNYEFLRSGPQFQEFQALAGFYNRMYQGFDSFLVNIPGDNLVTNFQFGVGDGVTRQFAVTRDLGGFSEPVGYAVPTSVSINGGVTTAYLLLQNRVIQFNAAPAAGAALRWTGTYGYRCTFADDTLSADEFMHEFYQSKSVKVKTDKP